MRSTGVPPGCRSMSKARRTVARDAPAPVGTRARLGTARRDRSAPSGPGPAAAAATAAPDGRPTTSFQRRPSSPPPARPGLRAPTLPQPGRPAPRRRGRGGRWAPGRPRPCARRAAHPRPRRADPTHRRAGAAPDPRARHPARRPLAGSDPSRAGTSPGTRTARRGRSGCSQRAAPAPSAAGRPRPPSRSANGTRTAAMLPLRSRCRDPTRRWRTCLSSRRRTPTATPIEGAHAASQPACASPMPTRRGP